MERRISSTASWVPNSAATDSLDVDRMLDRLAADPPIQTVVDQVAPEFGTQEAVDEILRSMTQSIRSNDD